MIVLFTLICSLLLQAQTRANTKIAPDTPPAPVFDVKRFGAKGDGKTNDHDAVQRAIDACRGTGGSVVLKEGDFLTGQITLGSHMTLFIAPSATLSGVQSTSDVDYPTRTAATDNHMNGTCQRRLIWAEGLDRVTITGGGTIDGHGDFPAWGGKDKVPENTRPSIIEFSKSTHVTVSDLTLRRPATWTEVYLECTGVTLRRLRVDTGQSARNLDGVDICDCHDVMIEDCDIRSQDDGICFKSGNAVGCRDIVVRHCTVDKFGIGAGNCVKFGTPTFGGFVNVLCEDLTLKNTGNTAISWECVDGAEVRNVEVLNCTVTGAAQVISVLLGDRRPPSSTTPARFGSVSDLTFRNIRSAAGTKPIGCLIAGAAGHPVQNIRFVDVALQVPGGVTAAVPVPPNYAGGYPEGTHFGDLPAYGFFVRHADNVSFSHCKVTTTQPDVRPWLASEDVRGLTTTDPIPVQN